MNIAPINYRVNSAKFLDNFIDSNTDVIPSKKLHEAIKNIGKIESQEKEMLLVDSKGRVEYANPKDAGTKSRPDISKIRVSYFLLGHSIPFRSEIIENNHINEGED